MAGTSELSHVTSPSGTSPRVEDLLAALSTEEKIGQLIQYFYFQFPENSAGGPLGDLAGQPRMVEEALTRGGVGSLLFVKDPAQTNRLQRAAIDGNPHGIPVLFGFDVIHGLRTIFPVPIALAASWNAELIEQVQAVAATEARAVGIHWVFAPMVDIARDPRWGRIVEGAGEDPLLGSVVAAAQVRGFQGDSPGAPGRVIAGPKHFAGYGAALGGRDYDEVDLSDQEFWNTYLPPFAAAVEAGAGNIMSAYMDLNGVPASGNRWLLTDVLRGALGFDGFVVTDANAARDLVTHHFAAGPADAAARALTAGVDMEMTVENPAFGHLGAALADGRITPGQLDESVRRILVLKEALGLFDQPFVDEDAAREVLARPAHRDAAQQAAEQAAVLLRNDDGALPLNAAALRRVAVIGPLADSARDTLGPWVFDHDLSETVTILDGIRGYLGDRAAVSYEPGIAVPVRTFPSMFDRWEPGQDAGAGFDPAAALDRAVRAAADADVVIAVLGERQDMIGEAASRSDLSLPGEQQELLAAVAATGTPVVLVLMSGRPLELRGAAETVPAVLQAWYPGTRGGAAVARLLFGDVTPAGKLPFTWPRGVGQVPVHHAVTRSHAPAEQGRRYWDEESTPLFPFGHGLSYARFAYRDLRVEPASGTADGTVTVTVELANVSDRDGTEVAQLYLHQRYGTSSRPLRQLKAFRRVELAAGATETVTFTVGPDERRYWSAATRGWVTDASTFDVWVGGDATATLHAEFTVTADLPGAPADSREVSHVCALGRSYDSGVTQEATGGEPGRRSYPKGVRRRQQILDSVIELLAQRGGDRTSLRTVGQAIGVSHTALRHYFSSRDELLVEAYRAHESREPVDPHAAGDSAVGLIIGSAERNRSIPGLVELYATLTTDALQEQHAVTREFIRERFGFLRSVLAARIEDGQRAGAIAADIDPVDAAALVIAASDGLQVQWLLEPDTVDVGRVLSLLERLLGGSHGPGPSS